MSAPGSTAQQFESLCPLIPFLETSVLLGRTLLILHLSEKRNAKGDGYPMGQLMEKASPAGYLTFPW